MTYGDLDERENALKSRPDGEKSSLLGQIRANKEMLGGSNNNNISEKNEMRIKTKV